jgi:serine/threonine protein kinase
MSLCLFCGRLAPDDAAACPTDGEALIPFGPALAPGSRPLPGFTVRQAVGVGQSGEIYDATDEKRSDGVVLRLLCADLSEDRRIATAVRVHLQKMVPFRHPAVVPVRAVGLWKDRLVVVRDRAEGEQLLDVVARTGALPVPRALERVRRIAAVLADTHRVGVLHLQLRASNVLVTGAEGSDDVRLVDFGIGPVRRVGDRIVYGPPAFLSPEQVEGKPPSLRSDLFQVGVLLHHLIAGCPPWSGPDDAVARAVVASPLPELRTPDGEPVPDAVADLISHLSQKMPAQRPAGMAKVVEALDRILGGEEVRRISAAPPKPNRTPPPRVPRHSEPPGRLPPPPPPGAGRAQGSTAATGAAPARPPESRPGSPSAAGPATPRRTPQRTLLGVPAVRPGQPSPAATAAAAPPATRPEADAAAASPPARSGSPSAAEPTPPRRAPQRTLLGAPAVRPPAEPVRGAKAAAAGTPKGTADIETRPPAKRLPAETPPVVRAAAEEPPAQAPAPPLADPAPKPHDGPETRASPDARPREPARPADAAPAAARSSTYEAFDEPDADRAVGDEPLFAPAGPVDPSGPDSIHVRTTLPAPAPDGSIDIPINQDGGTDLPADAAEAGPPPDERPSPAVAPPPAAATAARAEAPPPRPSPPEPAGDDAPAGSIRRVRAATLDTLTAGAVLRLAAAGLVGAAVGVALAWAFVSFVFPG